MSVFSNIYKESYEKINNETAYNDLNNVFSLYEIYENTIINSFVWDKLPTQKNGRPLYFTRPEQYLYYRGLMAAFVDDDGETGLMYPAFPCGSLRDDGFYTEYIMYSFNGKNWRRKFEDIELCENLPNQLPTRPLVMYYTEKMKEILNTIDVQLIKTRGGDIFEVSNEQQANQVAKLWDKMKNNIPIQTIINNDFKNKLVNKISVYDSRESQILDLWKCFDEVKSELMTHFGLTNTDTEKKERLVVPEVNSNNEITKHGLFETMYLCRLDFCERCQTHEGWENIFGDIMVLKNRNTDDNVMDEILEEVVADDTQIDEIHDEIIETTQEIETQVSETKTDETVETDESEGGSDE